MINNLELKLQGKLPITRLELLDVVSSWGRRFSFDTIENITIYVSKPKECYDLSNLDVSQIDNLADIFTYSYYNGDLSKWNISNCTDIRFLFYSSNFNNDSLKDWDVSNVENMNFSFKKSQFNGNLSNWNFVNCKYMNSMFQESKFNNDSIKNWDVSNIEDMRQMFNDSSFSSNVSNWKFNKNIDSFSIFNNSSFLYKYNNGKMLPTDTNDFLEWFEDNRLNIASLNITKEEELDIDNYLNEFMPNNLKKFIINE